MTYEQFMSDPSRIDLFLVELYPVKRDTGTEEVLRFSTDTYATLPDETPANQPYRARVISAFDYIESAIDPEVSSASPGNGGTVRLGQRSGDLEYLRSDFYWSGRKVVVRHGGYSPLLGERLSYADMRERIYSADQISILTGEIRILIKDFDPFDKPLQFRRMRGLEYCLYQETDKVEYGSPAALDITGDLTITAWVWLTDDVRNRRILSWISSGATTYPFHFFCSQAGELRFLASGTGEAVSSFSVPVEQWVQVAAVRSGGIINFLCYEEVSGEEYSSIHLVTGAPEAADGVLHTFFKYGMISDLRVFSSALTEQEIRDRRLRALSAAEIDDAKGYWQFNQALATTIPDLTGTAEGTITGEDYSWLPTLEGARDLEGRVKPDAWGNIQNVAPALVCAASQIYMVGAEDFYQIEPREGGDLIPEGEQDDSLLEFLSSTPSPGTFNYYADSSGTFFALASPPSKPITVNIYSDENALSAAEAASQIATKRTELNNLDLHGTFATFPANDSCHLWADSEMTIRQALERVLASVGAHIWLRRSDGLLTIKRLEKADGQIAILRLTENDMRAPKETRRKKPPMASVNARRENYTPMTVDQLSANVIGTSRQVRLEAEHYDAIRSSSVVRKWFPDAREVVLETQFSTADDALDEAERRLDLFSDDPSMFEISIPTPAIALERLDVVELEYLQRTDDGTLAHRFGMIGNNWVVLAIRESQRSRETTLTIWRENYA